MTNLTNKEIKTIIYFLYKYKDSRFLFHDDLVELKVIDTCNKYNYNNMKIFLFENKIFYLHSRGGWDEKYELKNRYQINSKRANQLIRKLKLKIAENY